LKEVPEKKIQLENNSFAEQLPNTVLEINLRVINFYNPAAFSASAIH